MKRGARIISAAGEATAEGTDDPSAVLFRRLLDSFGEYERLLIGARTKAALAAKRQRGERISRFLPYGFTLAVDGRKLEPLPAEQAVIQVARVRRADGATLKAIAGELNAQGLRTRAHTPFRWESIRDLLARDVE